MKKQTVIVENFKTYLAEIGYSKSTMNMLPSCVKEFLEYTNAKQLINICNEQINNYYEHLQTRKHKRKDKLLSEIFISHHIYSLKVFFGWLEKTEQIFTNPISNLQFRKPHTNAREPLSQEQIKILFAGTKTAQEKAVLHLFYSCGLRRNEAEKLNIADIHFAKNILYVRAGKGEKRRAVPFTEQVKKDLENYWNNERLGSNNEAFIINTKNNRMSGNSYNLLLKKIITNCSLQIGNCSLHHLRHSIATHLLQNGLSIEFVRDFLGHSHLEATQIYTKIYDIKL
jgi:integrase/recombinase XerD